MIPASPFTLNFNNYWVFIIPHIQGPWVDSSCFLLVMPTQGLNLKMALWLCSDAASFITGETIMIDGGYTAKWKNCN